MQESSRHSFLSAIAGLAASFIPGADTLPMMTAVPEPVADSSRRAIRKMQRRNAKSRMAHLRGFSGAKLMRKAYKGTVGKAELH